VPIEAYSSDTVELLRDIQARWQSQRKIRDSAVLSADPDPVLTEAMHAPDTDLYVVDVSFQALEDRNELEYLNNLPTSLVLPDAAVDRLRAAAGKIILASPDFQRLLKDVGARIVTEPCTADDSTASPSSISGAATQATNCVAPQLDSASRPDR
jgi:NTE family protein